MVIAENEVEIKTKKKRNKRNNMRKQNICRRSTKKNYLKKT